MSFQGNLPENREARAFQPLYVFVYGTLKQGYGNNRILTRSSTFIGEATTVDSFLLTNVGFPYMVPVGYLDDGHRGLERLVRGEVWLVSDEYTLDSLDALEGVSSGHYKRSIIDVRLDWGEIILVNTYIPLDRETQNYRLCDVVQHNGWGVFQWQRH